MLRRALAAIAALLMLGLAWTGVNGALSQWTQVAGSGQRIQTLAQLAYGVLSLASLLVAVLAPRWRPHVVGPWAASIALAAGLAPVVWGGTGWAIGLLSGVAGLFIAVGIERLLQMGLPRGRDSGDGAAERPERLS